MRTGVALISAGIVAATVAACGSTSATLTTQDTTVASAGVATKAERTAHLALTVDIAGKTVTGSGDADLTTQAYRLSATSNGNTVQEVLLDHVIYLKSSSYAAELDPGKSWVSENLVTVSKAAYGEDLTSLSSSNPLGVLDELGGSSGTADKGTAVIGGVTCTHDVGTIALSKVAATQTDPAKRAALLKVASHFHGKIGLQVWVGPDDLIHQIAESLPSISVGSASIPAFTVQLTFSHFGEKTSVTAPPKATVQDETQAAISALQGSGA